MEITALPASDSARLLPLLLDLHALHASQQPERYPPDPDPQALQQWLQDWLESDDVTALVAMSPQGALMGYTIYEIEDRPPHLLRTPERRAMVHHIAVQAAFQRLGIGRALMAAVKRQALERGADTVCASYASFNAASAALMQRMGLEPVMSFVEWRAPLCAPDAAEA